jgi:hypothetical protein
MGCTCKGAGVCSFCQLQQQPTVVIVWQRDTGEVCAVYASFDAVPDNIRDNDEEYTLCSYVVQGTK